MTKYHNNRLAMYRAVQKFLNSTPTSVINQMPQMEEAIIQFNNNINQIQEYSKSKNINRKGYTEIKREAKNKLAENSFLLAGKVKSLAINTKNVLLKTETSYCKSKLKKLTDTQITTTAGMLINRATENIAQLAPYGITPTSLNENREVFESFININSKPRNEISARANANKMLNKTFEQNDFLLKNTMDTLVIIVMETESHFYNLYKSLRHTVKPIKIPFALRVNVVNENNEPIQSVKIIIKGNKKIHKTSPKGTIHVKTIPHGQRTLTASKLGYITQTIKFPVTKSQRTDLRIVLLPLQTPNP